MTAPKNNKTRNRTIRSAALDRIGRRASNEINKAFNVFTAKYKNLENGN